MHKINNEVVAGINFNLTVGLDIFIIFLLGIIFIHIYTCMLLYPHIAIFVVCLWFNIDAASMSNVNHQLVDILSYFSLPSHVLHWFI